MKNCKFRGISPYTDTMIYGDGIIQPYSKNDNYKIVSITGKGAILHEAVNPATVGQFTGILDGQGREIYDGDIVQDEILRYVVEWNQQNTKFCINPQTTIKGEEAFVLVAVNYNQLGNGYFDRKDLTVIGNVHENPELLQP